MEKGKRKDERRKGGKAVKDYRGRPGAVVIAAFLDVEGPRFDSPPAPFLPYKHMSKRGDGPGPLVAKEGRGYASDCKIN
mgnify:CR=1 FL=1